ncbi:hypothetical protein HDU84_007972 [Entophlyctis sp. JEL0112]|nr:hypothetical protein HDU84_007972 [Entophlyctis sp. JEL0112]
MPRVSPLGVRAAPRIPRLMQARVRSARRLAGLELPSSSPPLSTSHADQALPSDSALPTNATPRLASGSARDIERVERQLKIEENMARMDERIRAWKEEKAKAKLLKKKGDMPF